MKNVICGVMAAGAVVFGLGAQTAGANGDFQSWQASTITDARLYDQMSLYKSDGSPLSSAFEKALAANIKYDVSWRANYQVDKFKKGECEPNTVVDFLDGASLKYPANWSLSSVEKDFESAIVRVESIACLKNSDARKAMGIFLENDFRLKSLALLKSSRYDGDLLCEGTSSIPIFASETSQCMTLQRLDKVGLQAVYGMIVSNASGVQPVYFRENMVTFVDMPNGKVAAHLVVYGRVDTLSGIWHGPARGKLKSAQKDAFEELDRRLGQ